VNRISNLFLSSILLLQVMVPQQFTIKFATLAPEGTSWLKAMREYDDAVRKESGGKVGFKIYAGGVQGDEKSVLRKVRIGQLQAGGFTGVGMGEIAPKVRVIEAPFLTRTLGEVDHVYEKFGKEFEQAFEEGGFVLLGWAEVGFVNVFTNTPINRPEDLRKTKMWTWEGDPIAESAFHAMNINPTPLSVADVLTSLQTGLIDAFYTSPYAAVSLQWFTRAKYFVDLPLADAAGAVLISKKYFDTIPKDLQDILVKNGRAYIGKLTQMNRKDNISALEDVKKRGIAIQPVSEKDLAYYLEVGKTARRSLAGKLYSEDLLNRVEAAVAEYRKTNKSGK